MKKNSTRNIEPPVGTFTPPAFGSQRGEVMAPQPHGQVTPLNETLSQTLAGIAPLTGQNISVNVSSPSPHLSFGEWVKRGVLSALGNGLLFPFRLFGRLIESLLLGVIGIAKTAIIIVLIPTLIWLGIMLQDHLSKADSVREGASSATVQGGEILKGIADGANAEKDPLSSRKPAKD